MSATATSLANVKIRTVWRRLISSGQPTTHAPLPDFSSIRRVALRFRAECAHHGPWEVAAALHMAPETEDLRLITYLFAHAVVEDQSALELAIEQGLHGFEEWLARG